MSEHAVSRTIVVPAPAEEVWDALIDPDRLEDWFADEVEADELSPGSDVSFRWDDGERRDAVVEEVDAPDSLTFRWSGAEGEESHVTFRLDEDEAGTRVTVTESGLTDRAVAGRAAEGQAWGPRLAALGPALDAVAV